MKIYVASSWRNQIQPYVVKRLCEAGHKVYDFRHPPDGSDGFHWSEIDEEWQAWSPAEFREGLKHPLAEVGYTSDKKGMDWAQACVMVMPCGRSAHLEAGYMGGAGKKVIVLLSDGEPELMYKLADAICIDMDEVLKKLDGWSCPIKPDQRVQVDPASERAWNGTVISGWSKDGEFFVNVMSDDENARGFPAVSIKRVARLEQNDEVVILSARELNGSCAECYLLMEQEAPDGFGHAPGCTVGERRMSRLR
jgi:hypothetical protein